MNMNLKALEAKAKDGDAEAQYELGEQFCCGFNGRKVNQAEGAKWFRLAAEQGHVKAQFAFGCKQSIGDGVEKNTKEALQWLRSAAKQGIAGAQYWLGYMFFHGIFGVDKNRTEAIQWFQLAAEQGCEDSMIHLLEVMSYGKD